MSPRYIVSVMEVVNVIQVKPCLFIRRMHSVELDQLTFEELKGINDVSSPATDVFVR
jgi:hypothetical protein